MNTDKLTYVANLDLLPGAEGNPHSSSEKQYICKGAGLRKLFERRQPDAVMNLAAKNHVDRSSDGPGELIDHRNYPFIANSHPVTRSVLIWSELSDRVVDAMGYAFFTDLPASTKFPADLVGCGMAAAAIVPRGRLVGSSVAHGGFFFGSDRPLRLDPAFVRPLSAQHLIPERLVAMPIDATP